MKSVNVAASKESNKVITSDMTKFVNISPFFLANLGFSDTAIVQQSLQVPKLMNVLTEQTTGLSISPSSRGDAQKFVAVGVEKKNRGNLDAN